MFSYCTDVSIIVSIYQFPTKSLSEIIDEKIKTYRHHQFLFNSHCNSKVYFPNGNQLGLILPNLMFRVTLTFTMYFRGFSVQGTIHKQRRQFFWDFGHPLTPYLQFFSTICQQFCPILDPPPPPNCRRRLWTAFNVLFPLNR